MIEAMAMAEAPAQATIADLAGRWEGVIRVGEASIPIVIRVAQAPDGFVAMMDSPTQNARDIPVTGLSESSGVVRFTAPAVGGRFEGARSADGSTWTGTLAQGGGSLPLILTRAAPAADVAVSAPPSRPQTPVPPLPYASEDVTFANTGAGITLAGTLTVPAGAGPFPAVVLLTGSGAQDRDETIFNHKPFAVWADALTRRGVAVLRFDDRGVGGSGGGTASETSEDFAGDAAAAMAFLRTRPEIDPAGIGFVGHSEGGMTGPLAVSKGAPAAFIVMIAGQAVSGADIITEQAARLAQAGGASPDQVAEARRVQGEVMAAVVRNKNDGPAAAREAEAVLVAAGQPAAQAQAGVRLLSSPWYRWFASHDPAPALAELRVPLLALYGGKDLQVPADQNAEALARVQPAAEVVVLPGLNHLMQHATTGLPNEYGSNTETLAPEAISTVVDWVVRTTGARQP
ncbi:alpha/beta hydrolase [Brevundimonas sp. NIBR11]|uniref:alpha/beta hydrolase family protein n=1 Tax=Brevundimonas sp. NIBR11 TaxID=3015999 RepID=UPI0022F10281|nr:alpha/beta hydrolase [Brevundimonas sp. NIBR11]WGM32368.1 Esterase EstD [Brevundimonas sp. NIBR11]